MDFNECNKTNNLSTSNVDKSGDLSSSNSINFNFDEVNNRDNCFTRKWCGRSAIFGTSDVLPMWVADMDFKSPKCITDAIIERANHEIFGYTARPDTYDNAIINWLKNRHNLNITKDSIIYSPGVVTSLSIIVSSLSNVGDKIMILQPVYPPFAGVVTDNNRELVVSQLISNLDTKNSHQNTEYTSSNDENLVLEDNSNLNQAHPYSIDFDDIESKIKDVKLLILCNPHNPVGRVWTREELQRLGDICIKNDVTVISDEIHNDIIMSGNKHTSFASISEDFANISVTCMSPTKTFNLAGLQVSYIICKDIEKREKIQNEFSRLHLSDNNAFSLVALEASYNFGESWLDNMTQYIEKNFDFALDFINKNIPQIKTYKPESTYLMWLDFSDVSTCDDKISKALIEIGKIGLNSGANYGLGGECFYRLNIACPKETLVDGLNRIKKAVDYLIS
ncbi:MAG: pyridoxal phosphate-dependent aminotransferase [Clostridioides sp.]|jgi:cystathionine beta-lyase|nr:pyridoxal phosphate-dependent aminotransferase [Clostridioides sp.]